ncbi:hypothetical protein [Sediminicoccus sp. BL-A-41-H5]|uniref:hypothetical protein n=1 Tax=Sediminicoccus sp. BL-A-41-H5 TaxID=3421106 RepID=UPI003D670297
MRLLFVVPVLLAAPLVAEASLLQPDPALRGLLPSFVSVSVSASAENRGRCALPEELAGPLYTTLVQAAARLGLTLPALAETERVTAEWQIASGGTTRAAPDQPPELPMLSVNLTLQGVGEGRCFFSGHAELSVTVSGMMVTAQGPRPLPSVATIWRRELSLWAVASQGQLALNQNFTVLARDLAQTLLP